MKIKTALLGFTIAGVTTLSVSCSGSSESNDSGGGGKTSTSTAGKSSTAGSSNGGANGNGGTKSGTAGTNNNGGTSSTAGTNNNNGGNANPGGGFNFGGAGLDPGDFMCDPVPTKGAACAAGTQPCVDGTNVCYCQAMKWACIDIGGGAAGAGPGGGGQLDCPATKPMNGGDCGDTVGICPYGQGGCACYNGKWACQ